MRKDSVQIHDSISTETILNEQSSELRKNFINKAVDWFNQTDTSYILPNKYNLTFMLEQSTWFEHYHLGSTNYKGNQVLGFAPKVNTKLGLYFGWRWIFLGYSFDLGSLFNNKKDKKRTEMVLISIVQNSDWTCTIEKQVAISKSQNAKTSICHKTTLELILMASTVVSKD